MYKLKEIWVLYLHLLALFMLFVFVKKNKIKKYSLLLGYFYGHWYSYQIEQSKN